MTALKLVSKETLSQLDERHQRRQLVTSERQEGIYIIRAGRKLISFCCNDYFGLSQHTQVIEASVQATQKYGTGAGAARLITGNHPLYEELEQKIATIKNTEDACVFGSGYLANIGTISAIVAAGDVVIADKLVHASIIDGANLSGAKLIRYKHNNITHLEKRLKRNRASYNNCLIITETIFGMDGDRAPIADIVAIAKKYNCWTITDDAHGLGITSPNNQVDIQMGTLSKAAGAYGGYIAGTGDIVNLIRNKAASFIYTTALPPGTIAAANASLKIIMENNELVSKPLKLAEIFCEQLGLEKPESPIVPIIIGDEKKALEASEKLEAAGFLVSAIRPPTVAPGTARLRFTFSSLHETEHVEKLTDKIKQLGIAE
jgi:8-amino-7-oxononanoate synthase